jgi:ubiquinone/menaquinone biosynthesis C-methylase UbiE
MGDSDTDLALGDGRRSAMEYDAMAADYAAHNAVSGANAYYERPATIELLGDVTGLRILEAGCGTGPLTEWLVDAGAEVNAFDVSSAMLTAARERVGSRAELRVADLSSPLSFVADSSVDIVVASLVLHYLRDWAPPLREFHRVLKPGGAVVLSTHHPAWDWRNHCPDDYFAFLEVSEVWIPPFPVTFWGRPLSAITATIADCQFVMERIVEARPLPELAERDPAAYRELASGPFFLHMRPWTEWNPRTQVTMGCVLHRWSRAPHSRRCQ